MDAANVNAVKLFYSRTQNRGLEIEKVERPRREHKLPNVLSKDEVAAILNSPVNIKHRAMLSLIYACGLRRSELLNLKPVDVDSKRGLLIIRQSKGNIDRIVPVSGKVIEMLRSYYKSYIMTLFMGKGELLGHSGSTGSFAFYYPHKDLFFVGDTNQMAKPGLPIRLVIKLAMSVKKI